MNYKRAIEILNPEHREYYNGLEEVNEACRMGMKALQEIKRYREIGTVEECREAVERQRPKRPIKSDLDIEETVIGFYECPKCKGILCDIPGNRDKFCVECGQAIQWDN